MITAEQIAATLGLTGVILTVSDGVVSIAANESVTASMQSRVQAWWKAGEVNAVTQHVTPLQMRRALRATGLKATVDAALASQSEEVREEWEYATEVQRTNPTLDALAHALGKTDAEIDDLFRLAATFV